MLSQAAVDAKGKEYACRLAMVSKELAALQEEEQQLNNSLDDPVETAEDDGRASPTQDDPADDTIDD